MKTDDEMETLTFLISALDASEWLFSSSDPFIVAGRDPCTYWQDTKLAPESIWE
jgi:hypothetical protein